MDDFRKSTEVLWIEIVEKPIYYMKSMLIISISEFHSEVQFYL